MNADKKEIKMSTSIETNDPSDLRGKVLMGARIRQLYGNHANFAKAIGKSKAAWSYEYNHFSFNQKRMDQLAKYLKINRNQYLTFYFDK